MPPSDTTLTRRRLEELIYGTLRYRRFTQDSPVMPDVWLAYRATTGPSDLLLTPHVESSAAELAHALRQSLAGAEVTVPPRVAHNEAYVAVRLDFRSLMQVALPMTQWWRNYLWRGRLVDAAADLARASVREELAIRCAREPGEEALDEEVSPDLVWLVRVVGAIASRQDDTSPQELVAAAGELLGAARVRDLPPKPLLWRVSLNRPATTAISKSILAVKADAATRLFDLDCRGLRWAVVDSGIDATHPAFRKRDEHGKLCPKPFVKKGGSWENRTRVVATYDFSRLRDFLDPDIEVDPAAYADLTEDERERAKDFRAALIKGRAVDWDALEPLLRVPHDSSYAKKSVPDDEHGTHVAGILTADWRTTDGMPEKADLRGIAHGLEVFDLRVLDADGSSNEFVVIAALQFVRHLNAHRDMTVLHGVNVSLSIKHDVANYACGRTPVCEEAERLVGAGTVVVAAAGNDGFARYQTIDDETSDGYRSISIVDPGNAERVITVGATHRYKAHTYGVSYFSSRGPTGDGRLKPDLVAPGEKIASPIPGGRAKTLDGTSMAAPHVSAAAALLMARYDELIGKPEEIKRVLCATATDLGRERYFQGAGMLDVLRALQSV